MTDPTPLETGISARAAVNLHQLGTQVSSCRACSRLVAWREQVATEKKRAYADEPYWGRPIPGWGSDTPTVLIVGLAPAAHGGNRTGRIFTGDRSGDFLFASLYRRGLAVQPTSVSAGDGQQLIGARMVAAVRCAPPHNRPTPAERDACAPWLHAELRMVWPHLTSIIALGGFAWNSSLTAIAAIGVPIPRPRPSFSHGAEAIFQGRRLLGSFHPSQQNTFTGRLTSEMLDGVLARAVDPEPTAAPGPR
jgi:uracil-DNA glycosylase